MNKGDTRKCYEANFYCRYRKIDDIFKGCTISVYHVLLGTVDLLLTIHHDENGSIADTYEREISGNNPWNATT